MNLTSNGEKLKTRLIFERLTMDLEDLVVFDVQIQGFG
jgi:hypothetical protein